MAGTADLSSAATPVSSCGRTRCGSTLVIPPEIVSLTLDVRYRRRWVNVFVSSGELVVEVQASGEGVIRVGLAGEVVELRPGDRRRVKL